MYHRTSAQSHTWTSANPHWDQSGDFGYWPEWGRQPHGHNYWAGSQSRGMEAWYGGQSWVAKPGMVSAQTPHVFMPSNGNYYNTSTWAAPQQWNYTYSSTSWPWQSEWEPSPSPPPSPSRSEPDSMAPMTRGETSTSAMDTEDDPTVDAEVRITNTFIELRERRPSLRRCSSSPMLQL
mmetsp:Transcript_33768/g.78921  ORF Transcript_33768/g.78921 Transcript_33768/m.78921 type:complete len:178 (-) Transcript_33768:124-657(-)